MKDCTTCKYGYDDERLGIPMCHHPKRFSEDCVDFNMHEEKHLSEENERTLFEEIAYPGSFGEFVAGLNPPPKIPKMKVDKDLEEAAETFAESIWKEMRYELVYDNLTECFKAGAEWAMHYQEKKLADAYEKGKQEGIRVVRSWESSPGQGGY